MEISTHKKGWNRLSSFSVLLVMAILMLVGIGMIPLLNIQYTPSIKQSSISVNYSWPGASARVMEQEVTSKLEGILSSVTGISKISSESRKDYGSITVTFKKNTNIDAARFEMAMLIRQIYPNLPENVSYPYFSANTRGENNIPILTYTLNAGSTPHTIQQYAEQHILPYLTTIEGVSGVNIYGATPYEWEIAFEPDKASSLGISVTDIASAINNYFREDILGIGIEKQDDATEEVRVLLENERSSKIQWEAVPVKNINNRIVYLTELATARYKERLPTGYFRINGLNTINLTIYADKHVNTIKLAEGLKEKIKTLETQLPADYTVLLAYDSTVFLKKELDKIFLRTTLCVSILLLFVFLLSRQWRYMLLILISLAANTLLAFILYNLFQVEIHLYSLVGITVSLGIVIDTSIIMIDHYSHFKNRNVFLALLAALLTTVGSLCIVFFLPEAQRTNLVDFSMVVIINLLVSLLIALLFIPALLEKLPMHTRKAKTSVRRKRRIIRFSNFYAKSILFSKRWKWVYIVVIILAFGIPVHWLPAKMEKKENGELGFWENTYNKTIGSTWYQDKARPLTEKVLGGSLRLFTQHLRTYSFYGEPERTSLQIYGRMPEGCTVQQLNEVMKKMENFLSQYDEIEIYQTQITSYRNGSISVNFKPEYELGGFPAFLQSAAIAKAISLGAVDWSVYGIGQGFSNAFGSGYKAYQIKLTGYNYEQLYKYAEALIDKLKMNPRVSGPEIFGEVSWSSSGLINEYFLDFYHERFAHYQLPLRDYYLFLQERLFRQSLLPVFSGEEQEDVTLVSDQREKFDVWHLANDLVNIDGKKVKLLDLGSIEKRRSGNNIYKTNQQYQLFVAYDFIGAYELADKVMEREVKAVNEVLPTGYKAEANRYSWQKDEATQYYLLFLVIAVIFFLCAILFESLRQPLVIISMIPISFIGVFLTFYLFRFTFDQGGFAAFVLLAGITVNAGIYIINDYNQVRRMHSYSNLHCYIKAYNRKIIPIMLTITSTVLGLIPFVYDGQKEVFWFSFAAGTMGGMLFSIIALIVFLPLFLPLKQPYKKTY